MPKVSILMPCFNAENSLEETLVSIDQQTYKNFELILVDDGSQDGSTRIIKRWAERHSFIKLIMKEHSGIIPSLNVGLDQCAGEYVARMDADDLMYPQRLEKQVEYLDKNQEINLVCTDIRGIPKDGLREGFRQYIEWLNSIKDHRDIMRERYVESPICHPSVMFRKKAVMDLGGYLDLGWSEDYDLWLRMIQAGMKLGKLNEILLDWRDAPTRLTRTDSRYSLQKFMMTKVHYLMRGPLTDKESVIIWGSGMHGKRMAKLLIKEGAPVKAFVDIAPEKIGSSMLGLPIISREELMEKWAEFQKPILLSAVGSHKARALIREYLDRAGIEEGSDYLCIM